MLITLRLTFKTTHKVSGAAAQSRHKDVSLALVDMWPCKYLWHAIMPLSHSFALISLHSIAGSMGRGLEERQLL